LYTINYIFNIYIYIFFQGVVAAPMIGRRVQGIDNPAKKIKKEADGS
jgi:hypothetical protein